MDVDGIIQNVSKSISGKAIWKHVASCEFIFFFFNNENILCICSDFGFAIEIDIVFYWLKF